MVFSRILLLALIFGTAASEAANRQAAPVQAIVYQEGGQWIVDTFKFPEDDLQKRIDHRVYPTYQEAAAFVDRNKLNLAMSLNRAMAKPRFVTMLPEEVIWEVENKWSFAWEMEYARWVEYEVDDRFLSRYGIPTDCADVAIALRWIFARIHKLPIGNSLAASGHLFTQASMRRSWQYLPTAETWHRDQRFREALLYVMDNTYTHSLLQDSYPVAINRDTFFPGVHQLALTSLSGHTTIVKRIDPVSGGLTMIFSNTPRGVRDFESWEFYDPFQPSKEYGGFLRLRWVEKNGGTWVMRSRQSMPDFSMEQYEPEFLSERPWFYQAVQNRLGAGENPAVTFEALLTEVKKNLQDREVVVRDGFLACQNEDCSPGTAGWEVWSTPSRDGRIVMRLNMMKGIRENRHDNVIEELWSQARQTFSITVEDTTLNFDRLVSLFMNQEFSVDPRHSVRRRWGLE